MADPLFKDDRVRAEWGGAACGNVLLGPLIKRMTQEAVDWLAAIHDIPATITCLLRTPSENDALYGGNGDHRNGVHVAGRGADLRWPTTAEIAVSLAEFINQRWTYDSTRPDMHCALVEGCEPGMGSSNRHVHLQSHPNTVEITPPAPTQST